MFLTIAIGVKVNLWSVQEDFLAKLFNCSMPQREAEAFAIQDAPAEEPEFEATDLDCEESDPGDPDLFAESSSSFFGVSDDEAAGPKSQKRKRSYADRRKKDLQFMGRAVCARACARLLGIGQTTLQSLREGKAVFTSKSRAKAPVHPSFGFAIRGDASERWPGIVMFLWYVYHSAAECMPTGFRHGLGKPDTLTEAPFVENRDPDELSRHINGFMKKLQTFSTDIDVQLIGPGTFKGERRHLQHGNRTELFYEYLAYCEARKEKPAAYNTFLRVSNKIIGPHLRSGHLHFRKPHEHAKCDTCVRLKAALKFKGGGVDAVNSKAANIRAYSHHILSQWLDRQIYWSLRSLSQVWFQQQRQFGERHLDPFHPIVFFSSQQNPNNELQTFEYLLVFCSSKFVWGELNILTDIIIVSWPRMMAASIATNLACVMQDGMDQAKFKCPRLGSQPQSKLLSTLYRVKLHVAATWIHGECLQLSVSDEDTCKDAAAEMEQLSRGLERVYQQYGCLPAGLCCQADNTYREMKNRHCMAYLILVQALGIFRWTMVSFLRVGHSHLHILGKEFAFVPHMFSHDFGSGCSQFEFTSPTLQQLQVMRMLISYSLSRPV